MNQNIQYITNESGARVGVLIDIAAYNQLTAKEQDSQLLTDLSYKELLALSKFKLSTEDQAELSDLLDRNGEGTLSAQESKTLDQLLEEVDSLNVLKARAIYTLHHLKTLAS